MSGALPTLDCNCKCTVLCLLRITKNLQSLWHSNSKFVEILGDQEFLPSESVLEDVNAYPWAINTKYYTAQVMLCTVPSRTIGDELFAKRVEAFIVHFDSAKVWEP